MEQKLAQELSIVEHNSLFPVFLDLRNMYDTVEKGRLIWTLEGYRAVPHLCEVLAEFWICQKLVPNRMATTDWTSRLHG